MILLLRLSESETDRSPTPQSGAGGERLVGDEPSPPAAGDTQPERLAEVESIGGGHTDDVGHRIHPDAQVAEAPETILGEVADPVSTPLGSLDPCHVSCLLHTAAESSAHDVGKDGCGVALHIAEADLVLGGAHLLGYAADHRTGSGGDIALIGCVDHHHTGVLWLLGREVGGKGVAVPIIHIPSRCIDALGGAGLAGDGHIGRIDSLPRTLDHYASEYALQGVDGRPSGDLLIDHLRLTLVVGATLAGDAGDEIGLHHLAAIGNGIEEAERIDRRHLDAVAKVLLYGGDQRTL